MFTILYDLAHLRAKTGIIDEIQRFYLSLVLIKGEFSFHYLYPILMGGGM